jgi:hypothetical protein
MVGIDVRVDNREGVEKEFGPLPGGVVLSKLTLETIVITTAFLYSSSLFFKSLYCLQAFPEANEVLRRRRRGG